MQTVFVYGSLMRGMHNHNTLGESSLIGRAMIDGYDMYDLGSFPAITPGSGWVVGEVYAVNDKVLEGLDLLEGEPDLYKRIVTPLRRCAAKCAYVYVMSRSLAARPGRKRVPNGDWRKHYAAKVR